MIPRAAVPLAPLTAGWLTSAPPVLPLVQRHWLFRPGALTAGLRQIGPVRLRVLAEYAGGAPADEARAMRIAPGSPVWIREALMSVDGISSVAARSLTPLRASHGAWQGIRRLSTRPLADMLYHDRSVIRSPFACRRLTPPLPLHAIAIGALTADERERDAGRLWARRSVFWRQGQPLLVAEGFLPGFWLLPPAGPQARPVGAVSARRRVRC